MKKLETLIRQDLLSIKPYSSARDEADLESGIFLDANENPFGALNRYPDPYQRKLKTKLAEIKGVNFENIFISNGSDELIDLIVRLICVPGKDKIAYLDPSYGMYEVVAAINNVETVAIKLNEDFELTEENFIQIASLNERVKVLFICQPNNPTGNAFSIEQLQKIQNAFGGILVIDEAYVDFAEVGSMNQFVADSDRLLVLQTFSKAFGLAEARVGIGYGSANLVAWLNKIKPPYNVSGLAQKAAIERLDNFEKVEQEINLIVAERKKLSHKLQGLEIVNRVYPSETNFLLVEFQNAMEIFQELKKKGIVVRDRSKVKANCLRITVGSKEENELLFETIIKYEKSIVYR